MNYYVWSQINRLKSNDKLNNNPCNNYQEMLNGDMEESSIDNLSGDIKEKLVKLFDSIPAGEITPEDLEDWDQIKY